MDKKGKLSKVSLPSGSQTEAQTTILEKQNLINKSSKVASVVVDKVVVEKTPEKEEEEESEEEEEESESDNEEVDDEESEVVKKKSDDVNLDGEFEKIVPFKFKKLSEESIDDEVDHEIEEILHEAQPLGQEIQADAFKAEAEPVKFADEEKVSVEQAPSDNNESKQIAVEPDKAQIDAEHLAAEEENKENSVERPPVPIQTYLWEDVKRAKEQGGYPWTHLYKEPLGPDEEPQSILSYKQSPRAARKASAESGTLKAQKTVRIQDEIEVQETENYIQDLSSDEDATEVESGDDILEPDEVEEIPKENKAPKGILKRSQQILENIKPNTSKFDSGSLKKRIKNPLQRIKKMADNQFKKVKSNRPFVKKIPVSKDQIVLSDDVQILKLKESPKSQHREIPSYVVKHQDSEDSIDIIELDESPMECRKRRELQTHVTVPDEIIELPSAEKAEESERRSEQRESTVESHEISISGSSSHSAKDEAPKKDGNAESKKREHVYEDIDDYISKITSDNEHVERITFHQEPKMFRQNQITNDPMFDEFSRDLNKSIRKSLSAQDDKMRKELAKKIPKIEELEKQISDDILDEKIDEPTKMNLALLAPISSIDSTSSDEDTRRQLSILGEESEACDSNKKKSFDDSSVDREIESLKNDGSDVSMTLIEDELKGLESQLEKFVEKASEAVQEVIKTVEPVKQEVKGKFVGKFEVQAVTEDLQKASEEVKAAVEEVKVAAEAVKIAVEEAVKEAVTEVSKPSEESAQVSHEKASNGDAKLKSSEKASDEEVKEDVVVKNISDTSAPIKISTRWSKMSDHEYEPIGEPVAPPEESLDQAESQKRKTSDPATGAEKKFLRTPTEDSEDNISAQDFQNDIETRFFVQEIEPIIDDEAHAVHQENTFDEAVIIDESPVKRDVPRKRNFMTSAQESGKNFHKKIKAQAGMFKTSLNNKIKKKPKETPVAVEVAQVVVEHEPSADAREVSVEPETIETVNVQNAEAVPKSKTFKMPNFTKNMKKPTMPKFKKPEMPKISLPDRPDLKMSERFSKIRKLGRSKSMKEESATTDSTSYPDSSTTPEVVSAQPTKKRFDFGTYPRLIRDKFKRPKLPERSDQSVRSETPPAVEFTNQNTMFLQRGPVASRWPEYDQDSGKYQQFNSESDLDRESSIERRMRLDYDRTTEEREDFEIVKRLMNEEQRQMDEMDRENQEIHLMAKQERYTKKPVERQESDVTSDEDKLMWSGMLNKDSAKEDEVEEPNALKFEEDYKFRLDQSDINRSYTPQTNQETQSSGSSGTRRRKGEFDDDDDYFLRETRVSNQLQLGDYISSGIKEGLSTPEANALTSMSRFDQYEAEQDFTPEKPTRSLKRKGKKSQEREPSNDEDFEQENVSRFSDFYKTFPPDRPTRKQKKSLCESDLGDEIDLSQEHEVPDSYNADDLIEDMNSQELFYHQQILKGLEHPDLMGKEDYDHDIDYNHSNLPVPPTPPRRRKNKTRTGKPLMEMRNPQVQHVQAYRVEQRFVPLAQEDNFTPTPTPRRTRSRSEISAHTLDDADSFRHDSIEAFTIFNIQDKENGYAQVRKELPSRPVRRKRSTKSLGERQFATMPHMKRDDETPPPRPSRNYSTIIPSKPPRRKSAGSLVDISQTKIDDDDYEEIIDHNHENIATQRLKSGAIVSMMKDRPLPPPPRPKREHKKPKKDDDEKLDKDDDAEKIFVQLSVDTSDQDIPIELDEIEQGHEKALPRQDSEFSESERVIEVEVSTQTDPVLDEDFVCDDDDEEIDIDEFLASDGKMKTLEDILKEEQEAEIERARQLAEAENLSRGITRFRESNQRSMSERSRASGDRSRSLSRPITPSAVVVERKKSSPIIFEQQPQTMTEAGLFIHPITYDDYGLQPADDELPLDEPVEDNLDVNNNFEQEIVGIEVNANVEAYVASVEEPRQTLEELEEKIAAALKEDDFLASTDEIDSARVEVEEFVSAPVRITGISFEPQDSPEKAAEDDEYDAEMQRRIEEMIDSVMSSAKEEVDWLNVSNEEIVEPIVEVIIQEPELEPEFEPEPEPEPIVEVRITLPEAAPLPPPRRRSTAEESVKSEAKVESMPSIDEDQIIEVKQEPTKQQNVKPVPVPEPEMTITRPAVVQEYLPEDMQDDLISSQFPNRLHLSSLEIDNLSVCSLQAGRIVASEIDSNTILTNELDCQGSHNITTSRSIELPPGFIEEIVERVRCASRAEHQAELEAQHATEPKVGDDQPPARPPLPSQFNYPELTTNVPPSFYQLRDPSDEEAAVAAAQPQMPQRRKRHQTKRKESTSEEDYQREHRNKPRSGTSNDSVLALGGQFVRACGHALRESGGQMMEILRASSKDENKRDLHIALIILILIVAGLILMGIGEKPVHHHHWDFFNPPDNHGR